MADTKVIEYGNQKIPVSAGVTLEQAKQQMARFFPELADPKVETKTSGETTTWVFSKKAGTKGAGPQARIIKRLQRLKTFAPLPDEVVTAVAAHATIRGAVVQLGEQLEVQAQRTIAARQALLAIAPQAKAGGDVL